MADSPALSLLKSIKNRVDFEYRHNHGWEDTPEEERSRAGWVFDVREDDGWRSYRITVQSDFISDAEG